MMIRRNIYALASVIMLVAGAMLTACSSEDTPAPATPDIASSLSISTNKKVEQTSVVSLLPLTGNLAFLGEPGAAALKIAQRHLDAQEIPLIFTTSDTKASSKETITAMRKQRDVDGHNIFFVTLSGPAMAARESFKTEDVALFAIAIHPDLIIKGAPMIRYCVSAQQEAYLLVEELVKSEKPIGLVVSKDAATTSQIEGIILPALKNAGKEIAFVEWFDVGNKQFHNLTAKLKKHSPEELLVLGYGSDFPALLEAVKVSGKTKGVSIFGGIGFVEMPERPAGLNNAQFRFVVPAFSIGVSGPGAEKFRTEYKNLTNSEVPYDAAFTYDAAMTLGNFIQQGKTTPEEILNGIRGRSFEGVSGSITFDENGESTTDLRWATFGKDGVREITVK